MTLCIAWRDGRGVVHLAGDSRLKIDESYLDVAIKVLSVRCKILGPSTATAPPPVVYEMDLAMAFAGSHIAAHSIKESLVEAFKVLQFAPGYSAPSMDNIAKLFQHAFQEISRIVCDVLTEKGFAEILLAGFCPQENKIKVYKFSPNKQSYPVVYRYCEVIKKTNQLTMIGLEGGQAAAKVLLERRILPEFALKEIIDDPTAIGVGGAVQYGHYVERNFHIYSEFIQETNPPSIRYLRGGVDSNGQNMENKAYGDLHVSTSMRVYKEIPPPISQVRYEIE